MAAPQLDDGKKGRAAVPNATRLMLAFALTPLSLVPLGLFAHVLQAIHPWTAGWGSLAPWFVKSPIGAYPLTLLVGLPLWFALRRHLHRPIRASAIAGFACGLAVYLLVTVGGGARDFIPPFRPQVLLPALYLASLGLWFGLVFGLLAYGRSRNLVIWRKRPSADAKVLVASGRPHLHRASDR